MLWALTTPSAEERTDLGAIEPFIVWINFMDGVTISLWAGAIATHSKKIETKETNRERITRLY
jgi:hypothetical protein